MGLPTAPVTLSIAEIAELNKQLGEMRHNVNNHLALMVAAIELIRRKPESAIKLADSMSAQTEKMTEEIKKFSAQFDKALRITRVVDGPATD